MFPCSQKEIPLANFTMHEIHCSRNIGVCHICKESFPKSEMKSHQELEHTQVRRHTSSPLPLGSSPRGGLSPKPHPLFTLGDV